MSVDLAALARATPVALTLGAAPAIDWGDLGPLRFAEPFFDQTVERWAGGDPPPRLMRTGIETLEALDTLPSLDPAVLIFHLSRCGSTLLSRLLATAPRTLVIAEPRPLNALLMADPSEVAAADQVRLLRLLVRALGRRRFGDERHYALKLSSWNIARLDLFRAAFPAARLVWLQRKPLDVLGSILADPPGWMAVCREPPLARRLFGITSNGLDAEAFGAEALAAMLRSAANAAAAGALLLDYRDLPDAAWHRVAPLTGLALDAAEVTRMQDEARFYSKDAARRPFTGDAPERRRVSERARDLCAALLDPLYDTLHRRCDAGRRDA